MAGSVQRLGWLVVFFLLSGVVAAQEKVTAPAQQGRDGVEKQPAVPRSVVETVPDVGAAKSKPGVPVRDEESVKSKGEAAADAEKSPALAPRVSTPGKRDPFRPFTLNARGGPARRRENLSPLEQKELSQINLVGIVRDTKEPRALVEILEGDNIVRGYVLKVGTPIGPNDGRVIAINAKEILIEETEIDLYGARKKNVKRKSLSAENPG